MCQNNGSSRRERERNLRAGISPGREDGDGAEVARLVDLKLHGLLPGAGSSEEEVAAVVIAGERRAAEQEQGNGMGGAANLNSLLCLAGQQQLYT